MRTTVRIDGDLMRELRRRAADGKVPFTQVVNEAIRLGLAGIPRHLVVYREKVFSQGLARVNLAKALAVAAADGDDEILSKLELRAPHPRAGGDPGTGAAPPGSPPTRG